MQPAKPVLPTVEAGNSLSFMMYRLKPASYVLVHHL
jgi:hypothetical protein